MRTLNKTQVLSYSLFALSAVILLVSFMITMNVQVLDKWVLRVPTNEIHAGDTVTLVSEYTKVRDVSGKAVRYIECENRQHTYIRYPLNEAVANRASGTGGTGIVVKVPETIPDIPTKCKFTIAITYDVYPWKKVYETNSSNTFQLLPKRDVPQEVSSLPSEGEQSSPSPVAGTRGGQSSLVASSSSNRTPFSTEKQSNTSQSTPQSDATPVTPQPTTVTEPQRSLVERVACTATLGLLC